MRRWIKSGKIRAIRVGWEACNPRAEIERFVSKTDDRLLVLYARVRGHDQRPGWQTNLAKTLVTSVCSTGCNEVLVWTRKVV